MSENLVLSRQDEKPRYQFTRIDAGSRYDAELTLTDLDAFLNTSQTEVILTDDGLLIIQTINGKTSSWILEHMGPALEDPMIDGNIHFINLRMRVEHDRMHFTSDKYGKFDSVSITIKGRHYNKDNRHDGRGTLNMTFLVTNRVEYYPIIAPAFGLRPIIINSDSE